MFYLSTQFFRLAVSSFLVLGYGLFRGLAGVTPPTLQYDRDIRPILSDACFSCHGPDRAQVRSGFRLDLREEAIKPAKSGAIPIRPGDPQRSALVERIFSTDPETQMPPLESQRRLSDRQRELLRQWILDGAVYTPHWSFVSPRRPQPPRVVQAQWVRNPVDAFILARLEAHGMAPSEEVAGEFLLRRITLDLTGLPPEISSAGQRVIDGCEGAFERQVTALMSTRAYAERQAQDWLDLARYADSNGFSDDQTREIWPYRDWVIDAFADNMPFDQFTVEQIAGDRMLSATKRQRIASAFHRNAPQAKRDTYPVEEYRLKGVADRVSTTGTVWLDLTLGCAECHDHRFDPISRRNSKGGVTQDEAGKCSG
ncbi:MAG: DUF1549 domain-containing protein [Pedosphaera sp.]|nr:DUF1549 domain-containing protein [Pedosphaera sp.]